MNESAFPYGTITFLFSDIEGSTRLWEKFPEAMKTALARHDRLVRQAIEEQHGQIIKTTGDGFHAAFETATDAVRAAISAQQALCQDAWEEIYPQQIRARLGLHTGEAGARTGDYYGPAVNRAARLMAIGHGGQILLSATTADLIRDQLPQDVALLDLGEHRLKDLVRLEHVYQLTHPALPVDFPALNSLDAFPNNLPIHLTSYIGREREMTEVKQLLSSARLLTMIGPGGTGKTRLALQVAADLLSYSNVPGLAGAPRFPHGVWLAELAPLTDASQVLGEIASIFELRETQGSPALLNLVTNFLRAKQLLLILDNCEHLIEECARLANTLLRACPAIKIIASSREALGIAGETIYRVPSLRLPDVDCSIPAELMRFEAVQLFVERAASVQPHFVLTERNASAVARVCQRLDGIPLAIELAAARVRLLSPEQIAARLDDRFRLLTGGSRTALPRQQTLRALIDWSYDMLSTPEQTLFRRLSVFTGGWTFEAAEMVCADDWNEDQRADSSSPISLPSADILDLLSRLVNKSLVIVNEQENVSRYSLLETIRQYAREQLHASDKMTGSGETVQVRNRHLAYYLSLAQGGHDLLLRQGIRWLNLMDLEYENIRSAFEWALAYRPEDALNLIGDLFLYSDIRTYPREGLLWVREALARVEALPPAEGQAGKERARLQARGYLALGQFSLTLGELITARTALDQAVDLARSLGDEELLRIGLVMSSVNAVFLDDTEKVHTAALEAVALSRAAGDRFTLAQGLGMLSWVEGSLGNTGQRDALAKEARSLFGQPDNPLTYSALLMMGLEARTRGDLVAARDYLEQCFRYSRVIHSRPYEAMVRSELAQIHRQMGNFQKAKEAYRSTILLWNDLGHQAAIENQLECFAFIARAEGQLPRAVKLLGAAEALREATGSRMISYEQVEYRQAVDGLRQEVDPQEFAASWAEGRLLSMEQAIAFALETD